MDVINLRTRLRYTLNTDFFLPFLLSFLLFSTIFFFFFSPSFLHRLPQRAMMAWPTPPSPWCLAISINSPSGFLLLFFLWTWLFFLSSRSPVCSLPPPPGSVDGPVWMRASPQRYTRSLEWNYRQCYYTYGASVRKRRIIRTTWFVLRLDNCFYQHQWFSKETGMLYVRI